MKIIILNLAFIALSFSGYVQAASCLCSTTGCKIVSDPYPAGADQPTTCTVYKAGVVVASAPVVQSSTVPASNAAICQPASPAYSPGPAGSVACLVPIPAQLLGSVTLTMTASNADGTSAQSAPFVFTNVATLPPPVAKPVVRGPWLP